MYLEHISIRNFRKFECLDLTLNPGLNLLVGENDSGKTALIDAIKYVLGTNSYDRTYIDESDFHDESKELSIQLKFLDIERHAHRFVEHLTYEKNHADENNSQIVLYVQLTAKNTGEEKRGYPFIITEIKSGKAGNGLTLEPEIRAFLSTTYLKPLRDAEAELSAGKRSRLSQILNSSKEILKPASIQSILQLIADTNKALIKEDEPIHKTSQKIQNDYLHKLIFETDKNILKAIIDIAGIKQLEGLTDIKKRKHLRTVLEGLRLSLTQESRKHGLGYNNLLFMAAELLLLEQELNNEFPLLLIEEPEAHLHPQLQMKLLQFIISKVKTQGKSAGIQCILSTHSSNIAAKASPNDVIILSEGKAFPLRAEETELAKANYSFLSKFLDVTKANLFFARGLILVEGYAENILLPLIAKLLGRPLEDYGVSIINIGNTGWKHFAKLFLRKEKDTDKKAWNPIKVAVLRDLDLWPICAQYHKDNPDEYPYGFINLLEPKNGKGGNKERWLSDNEEERKKQISEQIVRLKKDQNKDVTLERQNISVHISNMWTFEYSLSYCGLFDECYKALNGSDKDKSNITGSAENKATYIQREIDQSKTEFATKLSLILEDQYKNNPLKLKEKLPSYIVNAIEYVTEPFSDDI